MKFGLLGVDENIPLLVTAAQAQGHEIAAHWAGSDEHAQASFLEGVPKLADWDQLLTIRDLDAVIVASVGQDADAESTRLAPLRSLAQAGISALVCHPVVLSTIAHYELDMACEESGARLVPFTRWRWDPAVARLQSLFGEGPLGELKQVAIERHVADDRRETMLRQFSFDLDLIRLLIGDVVRLHAMTTMIPVGDILSAANNPAKAANWPNLGIQTVGSTGAAGRWSPQVSGHATSLNDTSSISPERSSPVVVQATGTKGSATLTIWPRTLDQSTTLKWLEHEESFELDCAIETAAIADFAKSQTSGEPAAQWSDACHAMHASESIGRSLKRGRVIDLNYDDYSEEGTFKGLMAAGGCLVLFAALAILTIGGVAGKLGWKGFDKIVPAVLLVLLVGFLSLQFLGTVFRKDHQAAESSKSGEES